MRHRQGTRCAPQTSKASFPNFTDALRHVALQQWVAVPRDDQPASTGYALAFPA